MLNPGRQEPLCGRSKKKDKDQDHKKQEKRNCF